MSVYLNDARSIDERCIHNEIVYSEICRIDFEQAWFNF
jgi:hypothetical protein